jgi:hypothetical protein
MGLCLQIVCLKCCAHGSSRAARGRDKGAQGQLYTCSRGHSAACCSQVQTAELSVLKVAFWTQTCNPQGSAELCMCMLLPACQVMTKLSFMTPPAAVDLRRDNIEYVSLHRHAVAQMCVAVFGGPNRPLLASRLLPQQLIIPVFLRACCQALLSIGTLQSCTHVCCGCDTHTICPVRLCMLQPCSVCAPL